jgi:hypothetical protein
MSHNKSFIEHAKKYQKEHGCTYREAQQKSKHTYMKDPLDKVIKEDVIKEKKKIGRPKKVEVKKRGRPRKVQQEGEGISDVVHNIKEGVASRLSARPLSMTNLLKSYGDKVIAHVEVCRQPITEAIKKALDVVSRGNISKVVAEKGYDNVYHLYCIVVFTDNSRVRLDKNHRVTIEIDPKPLRADAVCKKAVLPKHTTFEQFIIKGEKLGNDIGSFWRYSGWDNNCQKFIKALMNASGVTSLDSFIYQDTQSLIKPGVLRKFTGVVTDVAALADYAVKGGSRKRKKGCGCGSKKSCSCH